MDRPMANKWVDLLEARQPSDTIEYADSIANKIERVTATLRGRDSEAYTKLAQKLEKIEILSKEVDTLKKEVKSTDRQIVADLFDADDTVRTRVVETVSVTLQLTKDPKATESPQYSKILAELEKSLTPDLIKVLEGLKKKYVTVIQKEPALSYEFKDKTLSAKNESRITEGFVSDVIAGLGRFLQIINVWARRYDAKLDAIKAQLNS